MSAISRYVYYNYDRYLTMEKGNVSAQHLLNSNFSQQKINLKYKESRKRLSQALEDTYLAPLKNLGIVKNNDEFYKLLEDLKENVLPKAANEMVQKVGSTKSRSEMTSLTEDLSKNALKLQKVIDEVKDSINMMTRENINLDDILIISLINDETLKKSESFRYAYRDVFLKKSNIIFKPDAKTSQVAKSHSQTINKLLSNLSMLKAYQNNQMENLPSKLKSETLTSLIYSSYITINKMIGLFSEEYFVEPAEKELNTFLKKHLNGQNYAQVKMSGLKQTDSKVNTQDIELSIINENGKGGQIKINLPGASLKRTVVKNNKVTIHAKSKTNLSRLTQEMGREEAKIFYQTLACYNMANKRKTILKNGQEKEVLDKAVLSATKVKNEMLQMYDYFHVSNILTSLAGQLKLGDFAYFIVINDKVYSVLDVLEQLQNNNNPRENIISNISSVQNQIKTYHNEVRYKKNRSDLVLNQLDQAKITMDIIFNIKS